MVYGYARVSTKGQDRYGSSLEVQEKQLREAGADVVVYESFTGTKKDRPELNKLLSTVQSGDEIVVSKLDRMARSAHDGIEIVEEFVSKGVRINVLNMGKFDDSPSGKLMRTIFFAFAEFERDMIVERTTSGKEVAKANNPNWKEGRKQIELPDFEKFLKKQKDGSMSVTECCEAMNISKATWYRRIREIA